MLIQGPRFHNPLRTFQPEKKDEHVLTVLAALPAIGKARLKWTNMYQGFLLCSPRSAELASLITMDEHIPRVLVAFSAIGPFLAARMSVAAILAQSACLWTIGDHPSAVFAAASARSVSIAPGIVIAAVFSAG